MKADVILYREKMRTCGVGGEVPRQKLVKSN
jgi:hypothetical protein